MMLASLNCVKLWIWPEPINYCYCPSCLKTSCAPQKYSLIIISLFKRKSVTNTVEIKCHHCIIMSVETISLGGF